MKVGGEGEGNGRGDGDGNLNGHGSQNDRGNPNEHGNPNFDVDEEVFRQFGTLLRWCDKSEKNRRRYQVVTLQSQVWGALPRVLQEAFFKEGKFHEM